MPPENQQPPEPPFPDAPLPGAQAPVPPFASQPPVPPYQPLAAQPVPGQPYPQPPYPAAGNPYAVQQPENPSSVLAIIGLVASFFLAPVGLVLCIVALRKRPNQASKIMAIIGLVVSGLTVLIYAFMVFVLIMLAASSHSQF